ncbi:MAG: peptide chain release factor N(5)-glutamine methyltransferase [Deltaproteobacteria bacterium]|nr:peptide chain release factor N(5)-glutamine methyltransferase [Deltaproteobacteria bacterium]
MQNPPGPREAEWTILSLLKWATGYFTSHGIDSPRATAEILLAALLNLKRIDLYLRYDQPLLKSELSEFKSLIKRRVNREPVAYITGKKEFWSLDLEVNPDVLIPRPDTETLVEAALSCLKPMDSSPNSSEQVLELGTGSGAIVLALASEQPKYRYIATDISLKALDIAKINARRHQLETAIQFVAGNWLNPFSPNKPVFDMILSNPPYIPSEDISGLQPEVNRFEPLLALDGRSDGLHAIRQIIFSAHPLLKPQGVLLLEMGFNQKEAVIQLIQHCGHYHPFQIIKDYAGHDRVVVMYKT